MQEHTCYREWGLLVFLILLNNQILVSMICFWLAKPKNIEENQEYVSLAEGSPVLIVAPTLGDSGQRITKFGFKS